jgi:hypothetical protein
MAEDASAVFVTAMAGAFVVAALLSSGAELAIVDDGAADVG